jgi:hypothetical protein
MAVHRLSRCHAIAPLNEADSLARTRTRYCRRADREENAERQPNQAQ